MNLARMRTCGGGGTRETAVGGYLLLCCTCARGLRMPPSASFIVGFVRVVIVGQEWLRQVQQSSRTRGTDSIGDAICLMVLQLLSCSVRISSRRVIELASEK